MASDMLSSDFFGIRTSTRTGRMKNPISLHGFVAVLTVFASCGHAHATMAPEREPLTAIEQLPTTSTLQSAYQACKTLSYVRGLQSPVATSLLLGKPSFPLIAEYIEDLAKSPFAFGPSPQAAAISRVKRGSELLLSHTEVIRNAQETLRSIRKNSPALLDETEELLYELLVSDPPARINAASQLVMLTQRVGRSAAELLTIEGLDPESFFLLRKDTETFLLLAEGLRDGNTHLRLKPAKSASQRQRLTTLAQRFVRIKQDADALLANTKNLVAAKEAQTQLLVDLFALDRAFAPLCTSGSKQ
jgi:hypothetical protein